MARCISIGCAGFAPPDKDFCVDCASSMEPESPASVPLPELYSKYYKDVKHLTEVDVYAVHLLFNIQDPSGAIQHASKKLLLSGVRTGGKSVFDDVREARDTLTRWLQLQEQMGLV